MSRQYMLVRATKYHVPRRTLKLPCGESLCLSPAARCHGCRVGVASGNDGDGCVGKVLRVHERRLKPALLVV